MSSQPQATTDAMERVSEQGNRLDVEMIRSFIFDALSQETVIDRLNDTLFEHVVEGRLHPSVIASSLRGLIDEVLDAAEYEDWQHAADTLISQARETLGADANAA